MNAIIKAMGVSHKLRIIILTDHIAGLEKFFGFALITIITNTITTKNFQIQLQLFK